MTLNIITANVNGLSDHIKRRKVFQYFREKNFDVILLQETHSTIDNEKFWRSQWGAKLFLHMVSQMREELQF